MKTRKTKMKVSELEVGMRLDLAGDKFADPHRKNVILEFESAQIADIEHETDTCIRLSFENWEEDVGFPPDHEVTVLGGKYRVEFIGFVPAGSPKEAMHQMARDICENGLVQSFELDVIDEVKVFDEDGEQMNFTDPDGPEGGEEE